MRWIKTAIGAVIGIISIGIISISVYKMTHSSEVIKKEVSFEIDFDVATWEGTFYPISIYNEILEYGVIENGIVTNIVSGYVNNDEIDDITMTAAYYESTGTFDIITFYGYIDGVDIYYDLEPDGSVYTFDEIDVVNIKLVFDVPQPPQLTGNSAALILLIPIVFVGGVLYFYKPFKKD